MSVFPAYQAYTILFLITTSWFFLGETFFHANSMWLCDTNFTHSNKEKDKIQTQPIKGLIHIW